MKRSALYAYQWITALSDTGTGVLLYVAPLLTLRMMGVHAPTDAAPYISYIGAFVLSIGIACLYGALLISRNTSFERLEAVWVITGVARACVAVYLLKAILFRELETAWLTVALFDGACVVLQIIGLRQRWLIDAR